jgi:uncharacterized protein YggT (Ycf19 family)
MARRTPRPGHHSSIRAKEGDMANYERATVRETRVADRNRIDPMQGETVSSSVRTTNAAYGPARPERAAVAARIIGFLFGILQALLILRIVLLLLVANPGNDVVALILNATDPFVEPFRGMFALDRVGSDIGSVFALAALVALIGWTLIEGLTLAALRIFARRPAEI